MKKTTALKAFLIASTILHFTLYTLHSHAAVIQQVIVRQQWPWSTDIKVEYKLAEVTNAVDISVKAFNGNTELPLPAEAVSGDLYGISESGIGQFVIDPVKAFGNQKVAIADFRVELEISESAANINEVLYKIVDLTSPYKVTDVTRKDFYNGKYGKFVTSFADIDPEFSTSLADVLIWTDVTNDIYMTDKLVFRRIPAAGKSYMFLTNNASVNDGAGVEVSFSKDFYIGVFELTQAQVSRFTHSTSYETNKLYAAKRAADSMYWGTSLRGTKDGWPESTSHVNTGTGLIKDLQTNTGLLIDLPTEAMWEYACRAGTDTPLYTGDAAHTAAWNDSHTKKIMRAHGCNVTQLPSSWTDAEKKNCDLSYCANEVGMYLPNAFGLYDMLGNVFEWCLDRYVTASVVANYTNGRDPVGPTEADMTESARTANSGVMRGGCYNENPYSCHLRVDKRRGYNTQTFGARLCIYLDYNDNGTF